MKRFIILLLGVGYMEAYAQNESDALRFSRTDVYGTARLSAMGGAFTALGGDISGAYFNPAGVAVFQASEFSLTPAYHENSTTGTYYGQQTLNGKGNFNFPSIGFVGVQNLRQSGKWRNTAFSIGMNRVYAYHEQYTLAATDVPTSLLDDYTNILNEQGLDSMAFMQDPPAYPFDIYLAWYNYLLNNVPGSATTYTNASGMYPVGQRYNVERSGSKRETFLNFGGNYDDKLYLGIGVIFSNLHYSQQTTYSEYIQQPDSTTSLQEFSQSATETVDGRGIAANIGLIYRPVAPLRIGFSVKTPEVQRLEISYESDNVAIYDGTVLSVISPLEGFYRFRVTSPAQATLGLAYIFRKFGLISVDADIVNYTGMRLFGLSDSYNFSTENAAIDDYLQTTYNIRSGLEYRVNSFFYLRGGYAYYGNPYKPVIDKDGSFQVYSFGLGYRDDRYFVDGAYQYKASSDKLYVYDPELVEAGTVQSADHRITMTLGVRF